MAKTGLHHGVLCCGPPKEVKTMEDFIVAKNELDYGVLCYGRERVRWSFLWPRKCKKKGLDDWRPLL